MYVSFMSYKIGDRVKVKSKGKEMEGVVMPSVKNDFLVLKLDSGYNLGLLNKNVESVKVLEKYKEVNVKIKEVNHSKNKKTIGILHTGGTIASKVDYKTGAVVAKFTPSELIEMFPELGDMVNINSRLIRNMSSDDMRFAHYNIIAKEIEKEVKKGVEGIILTQGTDTIHYTAAALSFILEGLSVPVIIVGAQRSSDRGSSDAFMNLICAVEFILNSEYYGVGVCMHKNMSDKICWILPGLKCRKLHSSRRDAFKPVNAEPIAEVDYKRRKVKVFGKESKSNSQLKLKLFKDVKIGIIRSHPNMFVDELKAYSKYDGLILEGTGLGHMPISEVDKETKEHVKILAELKKLAKKMPVVMSTQTVFGRIDMNVYSPGRVLQDIGIIGNFSDLGTETSFIKLAWLISNYPKNVKEMFSENLRGEFVERTSTSFL